MHGTGDDIEDDGAPIALRKQVGAFLVDNLLGRGPALGRSNDSAWDRTKDIAGKLWNAPNTALGLLYGGAGMAVGEARHLMGKQPAPGVGMRDGAVQFTNNPFGGVGAITLGDTTTYFDDPYNPTDYDAHWKDLERQEGHSVFVHEGAHMKQGHQLGPFYLPSNLLGGINALLHGEDWHGPHNWNERGPQLNPPRPWAPLG